MLEIQSRDYLDEPAKKRFFNEQLFAEVAPRYNFVTRALSLGRDQGWKRNLLESFPERQDMPDPPVCVDLACGTGDLCLGLARRYPEGRVIGIDLSADMLALAEDRCNGTIEFRCADMGETVMGDASADIVTGSYALRNAADLDVALTEIARILKPGGWAAFLDFSKPQGKLMTKINHGLLKSWGGFWGLALHGNADVYGYIAESLARFPSRQDLVQSFSNAGLTVESSRLFYAGMLQLVVLRK